MNLSASSLCALSASDKRPISRDSPSVSSSPRPKPPSYIASVEIPVTVREFILVGKQIKWSHAGRCNGRYKYEAPLRGRRRIGQTVCGQGEPVLVGGFGGGDSVPNPYFFFGC